MLFIFLRLERTLVMPKKKLSENRKTFEELERERMHSLMENGTLEKWAIETNKSIYEKAISGDYGNAIKNDLIAGNIKIESIKKILTTNKIGSILHFPNLNESYEEWKKFESIIEGIRVYTIPSLPLLFKTYHKNGINNGCIYPDWDNGCIMKYINEKDSFIIYPSLSAIYETYEVSRLTSDKPTKFIEYSQKNNKKKLKNSDKFNLFRLLVAVKCGENEKDSNPAACINFLNNEWSSLNESKKLLSKYILNAIINNDSKLLLLLHKYNDLAREFIEQKVFRLDPISFYFDNYGAKTNQWERLSGIIKMILSAEKRMPTKKEITQKWIELYPSAKEKTPDAFNKEKESDYKNSKAFEDSPGSTVVDVLSRWGFNWLQ